MVSPGGESGWDWAKAGQTSVSAINVANIAAAPKKSAYLSEWAIFITCTVLI